MRRLLRRIKCKVLGHDWGMPFLSFWPDTLSQKHLVEQCKRCGLRRLSK